MTIRTVVSLAFIMWIFIHKSAGSKKILNTHHRDTKDSFDYINFVAHQSSRLFLPLNLAKLLQTSQLVYEDIDCMSACLDEPWCYSMNLKVTPAKDDRHVCELMSTDKYNNSKHFVPDKGYVHFSIKSPCESNPCGGNGSCIALYNKHDYVCACAAGFSGRICVTDIDECQTGSHRCHANAQCTNTIGSYMCRCNSGHSGNGLSCADIDECKTGSHRCHANAQCTNTIGSYMCRCNSGHSGNGLSCADIDECQTGSHRCHANAQCTNTIGSYNCRCNSGHVGNGLSCADINECGSAHGCHANAQCINTPGSYVCRCNNGFSGDGKINCNRMLVRDCSDLYTYGERRNGVYTVNPDGRGSFQVYCDMTTDGGGWTVFQRRQDGSVNFYLDWNSYKTGFGNLNGEFWLGNDNIYRLTTRTATVLRVDVEDWSRSRLYAKYGSFSVGDEASKYRLSMSSYSGTAGDALTFQNNMAFSTKDRDNDAHVSGNCASEWTGAWWYQYCHRSNLNGQYLGNKTDCKGVRWWGAGTNCLSLKNSEMKTKPQSL